MMSEEQKEAIRNRIREDRNDLLNQSDWSQLPDNSLTEEQKKEWAQYRQQLRDIPSNVEINVPFPFSNLHRNQLYSFNFKSQSGRGPSVCRA